ncbi:MAG: hypothetical protein H0W88_05220 [Parachlamydiaceae bacterium]|nr:hypothetical protein [Parachlamydiaceae bacterium]
MEKKITLTNEELSKKFKNNFDLVNYAISLAENMIYSGRDARVKSDVQNRAMLVLEEINEGKDQFDQIVETTIVVQSTKQDGRLRLDDENVFKPTHHHSAMEEKAPERRRARVVLEEELT